jgi:putative membrane-bound dehydrogenase-like protein
MRYPMFRVTARCLAFLLLCGVLLGTANAGEKTRLKLLFLGDNGHHQPARRFQELAPVLEQHQIDLRYTDDMASLQPETLNQYDGLIVYANIDRIEPSQARALLDYVASGKGFIPLHCATFCFRNNPDIIALMGAQFKRHGQGVFSTQTAAGDHPIMRGFGGLTSWDESYIHELHNEKDRVVLEYRAEGPQEEGRQREPWTWVRTHGKGRVFYTAWGHDERTWSNPGFLNLLERGIRWACGGDPAIVGPYHDTSRFETPATTDKRRDVQPFEYVDVGPKIPNYTPRAQWGTQAKPLNMMQKPLPAEESLKHFVTPVGFEVRLFASDPDLKGKPIAMTWDERGRLWVCETYDYPNELQPPGQGRDRIRICEDTDGDGKADRFTVFAEQLSIPTAITLYRGGAIVQNGTETLYLKDTDGDDRADQRKVLISGWALGDTHGGVSNFRYGLDNWIWAMQGYNNSTPVIEGVQQQSFRMGFFRFRLSDTDPPRVEELEFLRSSNNNTWGLGLSEEGLVFGSTANHNPSMYMPIPNRYYERVRGWSVQQLGTIADTHLFRPVTDKVRQVDQHGGYTAAAGHALYTGRAYPPQWWNKTSFVCGPTGHLVGTFVLRPDGSDFYSTSPCNLLASDDEWSAPIMAEVGPDGQVWVIDWYNYIVQHNPTPQGFQTGRGNAYESDLRDKKHGRIYRVVYVGTKDQPAPVGVTQAVRVTPGSATELQGPETQAAELLASLRDPTMVCRLNAQRMLVERGKSDVLPQLIALVEDTSTDELGLNVGAIHALWTLKGLGALDSATGTAFAAAVQALSHPSAGVRRNAAAVLPPEPESTRALLASGVCRDRDAQVQLAAVLALADMPESDEAGRAVAQQVRDPLVAGDPWLSDALTSAAAIHAEGFLAALSEPTAQAQAGGDPLAGKALPIARQVAEHVARGKPSAAELDALLRELIKADPRLAAAAIDGLAAGWAKGYTVQLPAASNPNLVAFLDRAPLGAKSQLIRLSASWGSDALRDHVQIVVKSLLDTIGNSDAPLNDRLSAARQLIEFLPDDDATVDQLLKLVTPQAAPELATGIVDALTGSTADNLGSKLISRIADATPSVRSAIIRVLLARPRTTGDLLAAVEAGKMQLADLSLDQKQALNTHPDAPLRSRAQKLLSAGGGLPNPDRERILRERLVLTEQTGDVEEGKAVFKKHCSKCHKHRGEGENIGPDLTGMAVHPKAELLTHILDPSRSVEGNFRIYTVVTDAGRIFNGMLAGETRTSIELVDAEAKRHAIQRDEIDELIASRKSLMPEGFEKQVTDTELVNLLEFLTDMGPFVPLDLRPVATITSVQGMFFDKANQVERLVFPDWNPKTFAGVPFLLVDPRDGREANVILLNGPQGNFPPKMPRQVSLPVNTAAKSIHFLSGVSGWGHPLGREGDVSLIVRLKYADGQTEDHALKNGVHFADYIRRVDVPQSEFAFDLAGRQIRYLAVQPQRDARIDSLELIKGADATAPVVMAITVERLKASS